MHYRRYADFSVTPKRLFSFLTSGWPVHLLVAAMLTGASPALARQAPAPAHQAAPGHPVQAPTSGHLADIFFTAGERVKPGQLLAKLERPDGTPTYLMAPVAGRIGPARLHLGDYVAAHATLAVIETPPVR